MISKVWILLLVYYGGCLQILSAQSQIRWCTVSDAEQGKCQDMAGNFTIRRLSPRLECVQARHRYECMSWVQQDLADLVRVDDTDLYSAGRFFELTPVVAEKYNRVQGLDPFRYKSVALIKAEGPITSLESLRGRKSCHTGVGETSGWVVPVSNLVAMGLMEVEDCAGSVKAIGNFFNESCSPGALDPLNNPEGDNPTNVCSLCQNPSACSEADVYSGFLGAFRCLHEGGGDVAFVTHTTLSDATAYYRNRRLTVPNRDEFRLLCPDGRIEEVASWRNCSWATRPSDSIVTSSKKAPEMKALYRSMLVRASRFFGPGSREFRMFNSNAYGEPDLLFRDRTRLLVGLDPESGTEQLIDEGFMNTMQNYTNCKKNFRLCVKSDIEEDKCLQMQAALSAKRISSDMRCVKTGSAEECLESLSQNEADIMAAGSGDVYKGGRYFNTVPIAYESTELANDGKSGYWAVAVVRKTDQDTSIDNLKGKTSCHTGIGKSAGWNLPVGLLVAKGEISEDPCDIPEEVGNFFSRSCIPGALDVEFNSSDTNPENMCSLCGGPEKCANNDSNQFYSYLGAFRCFIQFNADVAFVAHTTVPKYTDGRSSLPWTRNRLSRDFELLCLDGTRQPVTNWASCNLGWVPPHALLVNSETSTQLRRYFNRLFTAAQLQFGNDTNKIFQMFTSPSEYNDVIFKDSTVHLNQIEPENQTYANFLGEKYTTILNSLDRTQCTKSSSALRIGPCKTYVVIFVLLFVSSVMECY